PATTYPDFPLAIPFARRLAARVRDLDVDVFHAHHPFLLGPAAARLARRLGRPLVFTYHTRYEKYAHYVPFSRAVVERAAVELSARFARRADAVIAPSARVRDELVRRGVGAPPLRALAARLPSASRVRFLGARPHDALRVCYQAADLFLFASETETQGLVLAEAAACGLAAVAVAAPGCDEVVRDGATGVLAK